MAQITNSPNTMAVDASYGFTGVWVNIDEAKVSDDVYATCLMPPTDGTEGLKATNFSFSIPSNAIINGIKVEIEIKASASGAQESGIQLVKGGIVSGNNKSTDSAISTTESYMSYGGSNDLWGLSWAITDINASNFGAIFAYAGSEQTISVDHIRITVYYTPSAFTPKVIMY